MNGALNSSVAMLYVVIHKHSEIPRPRGITDKYQSLRSTRCSIIYAIEIEQCQSTLSHHTINIVAASGAVATARLRFSLKANAHSMERSNQLRNLHIKRMCLSLAYLNEMPLIASSRADRNIRVAGPLKSART
eukprot:scaffold424125_cov23-Prasinocladus_malaysianus.AAC.1